MEITLEQMAVYTFRELSPVSKRYLSVEKVAWVIRHRFDYVSRLTYKQKCTVSAARVTEVVQRRLARSNYYVAKSLIRLVLKAEEACYTRLLLMEQEAFSLEDEDTQWGIAA